MGFLKIRCNIHTIIHQTSTTRTGVYQTNNETATYMMVGHVSHSYLLTSTFNNNRISCDFLMRTTRQWIHDPLFQLCLTPNVKQFQLNSKTRIVNATIRRIYKNQKLNYFVVPLPLFYHCTLPSSNSTESNTCDLPESLFFSSK